MLKDEHLCLLYEWVIEPLTPDCVVKSYKVSICYDVAADEPNMPHTYDAQYWLKLVRQPQRGDFIIVFTSGCGDVI